MRLALAVMVLVVAGCGDPEFRCTPAIARATLDLPAGFDCADGNPGEVVCFWPGPPGSVEYVVMPTLAPECSPGEVQELRVWP